jgi:flagella basal body P-ring formation protein FlgA
VAAVDKALFLVLLLLAPLRALAQDAAWPAWPAWQQHVQSLAREAGERAAPGLRIDVRVGQLDPRLKLAPCRRVQPYLPAGVKPWGTVRIGLRCLDAGVRWNVFLPVTVDVYGPGLVAAAALPAGATLSAADMQPATVNLSASRTLPVTEAAQAAGRTLARPLAAGEPLRPTDLRPRQWFAAGDTVRLSAGGSGWRIHGEGLALNPGLEGLPVRVRTESGRIVSGHATGERQVEVAL